jgi:hypothetical protein
MKSKSYIPDFIISARIHMEMDFGFHGKDYHIDFLDNETDKLRFDMESGADAFSCVYSSLEELFEKCKLDGVPFEEALLSLDYFQA